MPHGHGLKYFAGYRRRRFGTFHKRSLGWGQVGLRRSRQGVRSVCGQRDRMSNISESRRLTVPGGGYLALPGLWPKKSTATIEAISMAATIDTKRTSSRDIPKS